MDTVHGKTSGKTSSEENFGVLSRKGYTYGKTFVVAFLLTYIAN